MSLRTRLIFSYILIIVICLGVVGTALFGLSYAFRDRLARTRLNDISAPIYIQVKALAAGDASLEQVWNSLSEQSEQTGTAIFFLDAGGDLMRRIVPEGRSWLFPEEAGSRLLVKSQESRYGTYIAPRGQEFVYLAYPLQGLFTSRPAVSPHTMVIALPRGDAMRFWKLFSLPLIWAGLIALVVSTILAVMLARSVFLPIRRVQVAAGQVSLGHYEQEVPLSGPPEVKGLARSLNKMTAQVTRARQALHDFVADVSHELRTPLTAIQGFAQAIADGTAQDNEARGKAATIIADESRRLLRLVNELLELSRLEAGQVDLRLEAVNVEELLDHCREIFMLRAEQNGIAIDTEYNETSPARADIDRLEQVLTNVLDNALKHTPQGGRVSIKTRQYGPAFIEITIADTGPGIPADKLPHIFDRFYKAGSEHNRTGTGLGLAVAREIVRTHGGDIAATSRTGEGTVLAISLPVAGPGRTQ